MIMRVVLVLHLWTCCFIFLAAGLKCAQDYRHELLARERQATRNAGWFFMALSVSALVLVLCVAFGWGL